MALILLIFLTVIGWLAHRLLYSSLRRIPGPFFAKFTDLQRFSDTFSGRIELHHRFLHAKYGPVVRVGPNIVSLSDPECIKLIYSNKANFPKSEFYSVNDTKQGSTLVRNIFSTRDDSFHHKARSPVQKFYTTTTVLKLEERVDSTLDIFCHELEERFVNTQAVCDLAEWFLFYCWDAISEVTFSNPIKEGFIKKGGDIDNLLDNAAKALDYFAAVGQIPILDAFLDKNPIRRIGPPSFQAAAEFCIMKIIERREAKETNKQDYLDFFLEVQKGDPSIDDGKVVGWMLINILAGADTTAVTLTAAAYYLLKNPKALKKLQKELDEAKLSLPAPYADALRLHYLDAVVKETLRVHPGVGMLLERVVPAGGLALPSGHFIPPETIVGINPWVVNFDKTVFGPDAESFNPDRWLRMDDEAEDAHEERAKRMKDVLLTFGAGRRICIGKELAMCEVYKTVATLFSRFDFKFKDPKKEWSITNSWFVRQEGVEVVITPRVAGNWTRS